MQREKVTSKVLASVGYCASSKTLEVEFLRNQSQAVRPVYTYHDVPPEKFEALMGNGVEGHSIGSYFLRLIKPNHRCTKVEEKHEEEKPQEQAATEAPAE